MSVPSRTRTSSEVKWLANELAAVKGELERIDEALSRLLARKERLLAVQRAMSDVAGQLTIPELPTVVPAVRAHERYGARGNRFRMASSFSRRLSRVEAWRCNRSCSPAMAARSLSSHLRSAGVRRDPRGTSVR